MKSKKVYCSIILILIPIFLFSFLLNFRILESMVPESMTGPLSILRSSAEGKFDCNDKYPCGGTNSKDDTHSHNDNEKTSTTTTTENKPDSNHV